MGGGGNFLGFAFAIHDCHGRWWEGVISGVAHMGAPPSGSAKSEGLEGTMNDVKDGGDSSRWSQLLHDIGLDLEWSPSEHSIDPEVFSEVFECSIVLHSLTDCLRL